MCRFKEIKCGWEISAHNVPVTLLLNKSEKYARVKYRWIALWKRKHDDGKVQEIKISVPKDFRTDGNSIPKWLYWLGQKWGVSAPAAVVHDKNYHDCTWTREDADKCFYDMCLELGVSKWKASMMYRGLRAFGWMHWKPQEDREQTHVNHIERA